MFTNKKLRNALAVAVSTPIDRELEEVREEVPGILKRQRPDSEPPEAAAGYTTGQSAFRERRALAHQKALSQAAQMRKTRPLPQREATLKDLEPQGRIL